MQEFFSDAVSGPSATGIHAENSDPEPAVSANPINPAEMIAGFTSAFIAMTKVMARAKVSHKDVKSVNDVLSQVTLAFANISYESASLKSQLEA